MGRTPQRVHFLRWALRDYVSFAEASGMRVICVDRERRLIAWKEELALRVVFDGLGMLGIEVGSRHHTLRVPSEQIVSMWETIDRFMGETFRACLLSEEAGGNGRVDGADEWTWFWSPEYMASVERAGWAEADSDGL